MEIEVARRLARIQEQHHPHRPPALDPREIYEELLSIAGTTSDPVVRERLTLICDRLSPAQRRESHPNPLAPREREVLARIATGKTTSEAAQDLALMPTTVKSYLQSAMRKLGTRNRVETIRIALRMGLIT